MCSAHSQFPRVKPANKIVGKSLQRRSNLSRPSRNCLIVLGEVLIIYIYMSVQWYSEREKCPQSEVSYVPVITVYDVKDDEGGRVDDAEDGEARHRDEERQRSSEHIISSVSVRPAARHPELYHCQSPHALCRQTDWSQLLYQLISCVNFTSPYLLSHASSAKTTYRLGEVWLVSADWSFLPPTTRLSDVTPARTPNHCHYGLHVYDRIDLRYTR